LWACADVQELDRPPGSPSGDPGVDVSPAAQVEPCSRGSRQPPLLQSGADRPGVVITSQPAGSTASRRTRQIRTGQVRGRAFPGLGQGPGPIQECGTACGSGTPCQPNVQERSLHHARGGPE